MKNLPAIFGILFLTSFDISAQIPENFDFLNHARESVDIIDVIKKDDYLIVAHEFGVDFVNGDYSIDSEWTGCAENYKFIHENDSTYHYVNWFYNCSDGIYDGVEFTTFRGSEISTDYYSGSPVGNTVWKAHDMTYDTVGGWWCFTDDGWNLLHLNEGEITDTINLYTFRPRIFTTCSGAIYVSESGDFLHFSGDTLEYYNDLPRNQDFYQDGDFNYLLGSDRLYKYDCDLKNRLREWMLPVGVSSFDQISFGEDDKVYVSSISNNGYTLYGIDSLSTTLFRYEGSISIDESISGIVVTSDSTHLVYGRHHFELIDHNFYRNIHTTKTLDYPRVDAELSNFILEFEKRDSVYDFFLDSTLFVYGVDPSFQVSNLSNETINNLNIFSGEIRRPYETWVPIGRIRRNLDSALVPFESRRDTIENLNMYFFDIEELQVELTGANFKFLENGSSLVRPELSSSVSELTHAYRIQVYPNPAKDHIQMKLDDESTVMIVDMHGRILIDLSLTAGPNAIDIDLLGDGIYYVVVRNQNKGIGLGRFIKSH